jgi:GDP-L-fucose synthase
MTAQILFPLQGKRVFVAGHKGLAGSAIVRRLAAEQCEILIVEHQSLDLTDQDATESWLFDNKPEVNFQSIFWSITLLLLSTSFLGRTKHA